MDRFDKVAVAVVVSLLIAIGVIVVRGDQVGIRVQAYGPTGTVSSRPQIQITFDEPVDQASLAQHFSIDPAVQGLWSSANGQETFLPIQGLQPGKDYRVTVGAGVTSKSGRALKQAVNWRFQIRAPRIVSLGPQDTPPWNLFLTDPAAPDKSQQITNSSLGVNSFDVLSDGSKIVYAQQPDNNSSDLYVWDEASGQSNLLYHCDNARCTHPAWRPDGTAVAFEHYANTGSLLSVPRIWLFDVASNAAHQLLKDNQITGQQPRWSPDGSLLAFSEADSPNILIHDFAGGKDVTLPSVKGEIPNFSPDGTSLILQKTVAPAAGQRATHLVLVNITTTPPARRDLMPDSDLGNDEAAIWADSQTLIVVQRPPYSAGGNAGSQIYSLDVNTGKSTPVLAENGYTHLNVRISPPGDALVFQRQPLGKPGEVGGLFLYRIPSHELGQLLTNQIDPDWLP